MKKQKAVYLDFEYRGSSEEVLDLVCCVLHYGDSNQRREYWLYQDQFEKEELMYHLQTLANQDYIFVTFGATAELRSILSLMCGRTKQGAHFTLSQNLRGYGDLYWDQMQVVDLYAEWKQLQNSNDEYQYGTYYSIGGTARKSVPPSLDPEENKGKDNRKLAGSLGACVAAMYGVNIDLQHKQEMRDIVLFGDVEEHKKEILHYCAQDTVWLKPIWEDVVKEYNHLVGATFEQVLEWQLLRGRWAKSLALMEAVGIPLDLEALFHLSQNYEEAKDELIRFGNSVHPFWVDVTKPLEFYTVWQQKYQVFEDFVKSKGLEKGWPLTATGLFDSSEEVLKKYDGVNEIQVFRQTKKALGQLKWFRPEAIDEFIADVGYDGRLRPFFGPWGTQTSRNAPPAKRFPPAMSSWLRCLMRAPVGGSIIGSDWSSQEFAIAAVLSEDDSMIEAYESGDPYVYFAKEAGAIPKEAESSWIKNWRGAPEDQRELYREYGKSRDLFKSTVLGLQYGMGITSLAEKLSADMGHPVSEEEADELTRMHKSTFPDYWRWKQRQINEYRDYGSLDLADGWHLWGDNLQDLSVANFPVQGTGAVIMREAVYLAQRAGLRVLFPLHDAIYVEHRSTDRGRGQEEEATQILRNVMEQASHNVLLSEDLSIRTEADVHPHDSVWVEKKGKAHYETLKKYLSPRVGISTEAEKVKVTIFSLTGG